MSPTPTGVSPENRNAGPQSTSQPFSTRLRCMLGADHLCPGVISPPRTRSFSPFYSLTDTQSRQESKIGQFQPRWTDPEFKGLGPWFPSAPLRPSITTPRANSQNLANVLTFNSLLEMGIISTLLFEKLCRGARAGVQWWSACLPCMRYWV